MLQMTSNIYTLSNTGFNIVFLAVLAASIIILGGIGVYLVEHEHPGANIT